MILPVHCYSTQEVQLNLKVNERPVPLLLSDDATQSLIRLGRLPLHRRRRIDGVLSQCCIGIGIGISTLPIHQSAQDQLQHPCQLAS